MQMKLQGGLHLFNDTVNLSHFLNPETVLIFKAHQFRNSILGKDTILKCTPLNNSIYLSLKFHAMLFINIST